MHNPAVFLSCTLNLLHLVTTFERRLFFHLLQFWRSWSYARTPSRDCSQYYEFRRLFLASSGTAGEGAGPAGVASGWSAVNGDAGVVMSRGGGGTVDGVTETRQPGVGGGADGVCT